MKEKTKIEFGDSMKLEYDEVSPFTGNKCVLIEADPSTNVESRICMESGYTTSDKFQITNDGTNSDIERYETMIPQLYKDTKYIDHTLGQVWYLSTLRTALGCLYADGTTKDDFVWKLAEVKELTTEERKQYPVEGKPDEYHTHIIDVDNATEYEKSNFKAAIDEFYTILGVKDEN